jgi:CRP-like cAMP-binding protein
VSLAVGRGDMGFQMSIQALVAPLLRVALFQGLKPLQITEIARLADRIVFKKGDVITAEGDNSDGAILIVSGDAECVGDQGATEPIEPGSLIGEMGMLIEHDFGATVVARGPVRALKITREAMHEQMLADPSLAEHLMQRIASRLVKVADELRRIDSALGGYSSEADEAAAEGEFVSALAPAALPPPAAMLRH